MALLSSLVDGHAKCSKAFILMEFGVLKIRHRITIRRLMFHHHIVTRDSKELIKKIYLKQKENCLKGDWYQTLEHDFQFIGVEIDDEQIGKIPKSEYRKYIKKKVEQSAFQSYLEEKEKSKKKMHKLVYKSLGIQPYMSNSDFSHSEVQLLYALRSNCYPAKMNFRKMNRGNLKCIFKCDQNETQSHIFEKCQPLRTKLNLNTNVKLEYIYGTVSQQKKTVSIFLKIDNIRKIMKNDILPGRSVARTPVISL